MYKIKETILMYEPFDEREIKDKEIILSYINKFDDLLTRNNEIVHFTVSAFILNEKRDKVLMIYHNIYDSWGLVGGHLDGNSDLKEVVLKEINEETGVENVEFLDGNVFIIDNIHVIGHFKNDKYVNPHIHVSFCYLMEACENEKIYIKEDENSAIGWLDLNKINNLVTEEHMKYIYSKIIEKAKLKGYIK